MPIVAHLPALIAFAPDAPAARVRSRRIAMVGLMLAVAAVLVAAASRRLPAAGPAAADDATFLILIRGMALIKALLAIVAGCAIAWRLGYPAGLVLRLVYLAGFWSMLLGSVVVWQGVHVGWAALLFHTGELTILLAALRDGRPAKLETPRG